MATGDRIRQQDEGDVRSIGAGPHYTIGMSGDVEGPRRFVAILEDHERRVAEECGVGSESVATGREGAPAAAAAAVSMSLATVDLPSQIPASVLMAEAELAPTGSLADDPMEHLQRGGEGSAEGEESAESRESGVPRLLAPTLRDRVRAGALGKTAGDGSLLEAKGLWNLHGDSGQVVLLCGQWCRLALRCLLDIHTPGTLQARLCSSAIHALAARLDALADGAASACCCAPSGATPQFTIAAAACPLAVSAENLAMLPGVGPSIAQVLLDAARKMGHCIGAVTGTVTSAGRALNPGPTPGRLAADIWSRLAQNS